MNYFPNKSSAYPYIELAALSLNKKMYRNVYVLRQAKHKLQQWRRRFDNTDIFTSIGHYSKPDYNSKAIYPLFFDIDCKQDLERARKECIVFTNYLLEELKLSEDHIKIYFSGNKGFHIEVPPAVFAAFHHSCFLQVIKSLAYEAEKLQIKTLDTGIYNKKRIWRLPDSKNSKSGFYKIGLSYEELFNTSIEGIKKLGLKPRNFTVPSISTPSDYACRWFREQIKHVSHTTRKSRSCKFRFVGRGWRMVPCVKRIEKATLPDGIRHQTYFVLARYYAYLGMHPAEAYERITEINARHPIRDPDYIPRAISNAFRMPGFAGCANIFLQKFCLDPKICFLNNFT